MSNATQRWTDNFLDAKRLQADPLADAVLLQMVNEQGEDAARRLFDELIRRIEMPLNAFPAVIQDFLKQTNQLPDWIDWDKVALANRLFLDHGPKFLIFLYYKSLPLLYCCKNGAQVLVQTGRLTHQEETHKIFARRIAETGQFLLEVMAPDALRPGGKGIQAIQKVRLIHASIRRFIPEDHWDVHTLGKPINQEDMALTQLTFSVAITDALAQFGVQEDEALQEAYVHTWAAIAALLGVDEDLLPKDLSDARFLLEKILQRQAAESEAGKTLTKALSAFLKETVPSEKLNNVPGTLIRYFIGAERAPMLGIIPAGGCLTALVPDFLATFFRLGERLEAKLDEPLRPLLEQLSQKTMQKMVAFFDEYKGRNFAVPEVLERAWNVSEK